MDLLTIGLLYLGYRALTGKKKTGREGYVYDPLTPKHAVDPFSDPTSQLFQEAMQGNGNSVMNPLRVDFMYGGMYKNQMLSRG